MQPPGKYWTLIAITGCLVLLASQSAAANDPINPQAAWDVASASTRSGPQAGREAGPRTSRKGPRGPRVPRGSIPSGGPGPSSTKPLYPFPQCATTTLSYDVAFVGKVQYIQVGPVRYAYHRFGPFVKSAAQQQVVTERGVRGAQGKQQQGQQPIVFITGLGASMYMWPIPLLRSLAENKEVVIFDNMRSGLSQDTSLNPLSIPAMADSTMALITALKLGKPDIWGWSVGGAVAYALVAAHGSKISNAIIAAGTAGGPDSFVAPPSVLSDLAQSDNKLNLLLPLLFAKGIQDDGVCAWFAAFNSFASSEDTSLKQPIDQKALRAQLAAMQQFVLPPGLNQQLAASTNRVLVVHGVQDRIVPVRNAQMADNLLLGSWLLQLPSGGHAVPFSHQQAMLFMTEEFLNRAEPITAAENKAWADYGIPASEMFAAGSIGDDGPRPTAVVGPAGPMTKAGPTGPRTKAGMVDDDDAMPTGSMTRAGRPQVGRSGMPQGMTPDDPDASDTDADGSAEDEPDG